MDSTAATHLAAQLSDEHDHLCETVAARLLGAFPELTASLRLEESYTPTSRLSHVAVTRLYELVRTVLLFEQPTIADSELRWAHGVLPRSGVTYEHQAAMITWFFEEVAKLPLDANERRVANEIERHLLAQVRQVYRYN
jgi:hypothetical protein